MREYLVSRYVDNDKRKMWIIADIYRLYHKSGKKYMVTFNPDTSPCSTFILYETFEEAESHVKRLRPTAAKLNGICVNCNNTDCIGTTEQVWTGCSYRL